MAFDDVVTGGSGFTSGSVATSKYAGYTAGGGWDEVLATAIEVGIGGSDGSLELNLLSIIRAKYRNFSMLAS